MMIAGIIPSGTKFRLDPKGVQAKIAPIRDRYDTLHDIVAWLPDDPTHWWVKEGSPILGARELAGAAFAGGAIPIYPTPTHWVDAGGQGFVVLDWEINLRLILDGIRRVETSHLPRAVEKVIQRKLRANFWRDLPQIGGRS